MVEEDINRKYDTSDSFDDLLKRNMLEISDKNKELRKLNEEIIKKTKELVESVSENIEKFRLHDAAQSLYKFTWHEIADVYIEAVKQQTDGVSYSILKSIFLINLKLLHPFMPFVTEAIYQQMPGHGESIMIEKYPA